MPNGDQLFFSEEPRFYVESDSRCVIIWREQGTRNNPAFAQDRFPYGGGGLMVWAGITIGGRTNLYIIQGGTMTPVR